MSSDSWENVINDLNGNATNDVTVSQSTSPSGHSRSPSKKGEQRERSEAILSRICALLRALPELGTFKKSGTEDQNNFDIDREEKVLHKLADTLKLSKYSSGSAIIHKNDYCQHVYFILQGQVGFFSGKSQSELEQERFKKKVLLESLIKDAKEQHEFEKNQRVKQEHEGRDVFESLKSDESLIDHILLNLNENNARYFYPVSYKDGQLQQKQQQQQQQQTQQNEQQQLKQNQSKKEKNLVASSGKSVVDYPKDLNSQINAITDDINNQNRNSQLLHSICASLCTLKRTEVLREGATFGEQCLWNMENPSTVIALPSISKEYEREPQKYLNEDVVIGRISKSDYAEFFPFQVMKQEFLQSVLKGIYNGSNRTVAQLVIRSKEVCFSKQATIIDQSVQFSLTEKGNIIELNNNVLLPAIALSSRANLNSDLKSSSTSSRSNYSNNNITAQSSISTPLVANRVPLVQEYLWIIFKGSIEVRQKVSMRVVSAASMRNSDNQQQTPHPNKYVRQQKKSASLKLAHLPEGSYFGHECWSIESSSNNHHSHVHHQQGQQLQEQDNNGLRQMPNRHEYAFIAQEQGTVLFRIPKSLIYSKPNLLLTILAHGKSRKERFAETATLLAAKHALNPNFDDLCDDIDFRQSNRKVPINRLHTNSMHQISSLPANFTHTASTAFSQEKEQSLNSSKGFSPMLKRKDNFSVFKSRMSAPNIPTIEDEAEEVAGENQKNISNCIRQFGRSSASSMTWLGSSSSGLVPNSIYDTHIPSALNSLNNGSNQNNTNSILSSRNRNMITQIPLLQISQQQSQMNSSVMSRDGSLSFIPDNSACSPLLKNKKSNVVLCSSSTSSPVKIFQQGLSKELQLLRNDLKKGVMMMGASVQLDSSPCSQTKETNSSTIAVSSTVDSAAINGIVNATTAHINTATSAMMIPLHNRQFIQDFSRLSSLEAAAAAAGEMSPYQIRKREGSAGGSGVRRQNERTPTGYLMRESKSDKQFSISMMQVAQQQQQQPQSHALVGGQDANSSSGSMFINSEIMKSKKKIKTPLLQLSKVEECERILKYISNNLSQRASSESRLKSESEHSSALISNNEQVGRKQNSQRRYVEYSQQKSSQSPGASTPNGLSGLRQGAAMPTVNPFVAMCAENYNSMKGRSGAVLGNNNSQNISSVISSLKNGVNNTAAGTGDEDCSPIRRNMRMAMAEFQRYPKQVTHLVKGFQVPIGSASIIGHSQQQQQQFSYMNSSLAAALAQSKRDAAIAAAAGENVVEHRRTLSQFFAFPKSNLKSSVGGMQKVVSSPSSPKSSSQGMRLRGGSRLNSSSKLIPIGLLEQKRQSEESPIRIVDEQLSQSEQSKNGMATVKKTSFLAPRENSEEKQPSQEKEKEGVDKFEASMKLLEDHAKKMKMGSENSSSYLTCNSQNSCNSINSVDFLVQVKKTMKKKKKIYFESMKVKLSKSKNGSKLLPQQ